VSREKAMVFGSAGGDGAALHGVHHLLMMACADERIVAHGNAKSGDFALQMDDLESIIS
jgi:hypothetical protein